MIKIIFIVPINKAHYINKIYFYSIDILYNISSNYFYRCNLSMPNLHHQGESKGTVKACANIKLKYVLGPEILVALADPKTIEIMPNSDGKSEYPLHLALPRLSAYIHGFA